MDQRAVVALVVVLGDHLPVRRHLVGVPVRHPQRARGVRRDDPPQLPQVLRERTGPRRCPAGAGRGRGPSPPRPRPAARPVRGRPGRSPRRRGSRAPPSAPRPGRSSRRGRGTPSPAVRRLPLRQQLVAAVPAGVGEHPDPALAAARAARRRRRPSRRAGVGAGPEQVVEPAQAGPAAGEQVASLPGQHLRRRCTPRQAASSLGASDVVIAGLLEAASRPGTWEWAGERPEPAHGRAAARGDPDRDPRRVERARPGGDPRRRRGGRARGEPGAGLLPLRHQGRPARRGLRARRRAGPRRARGDRGQRGRAARPAAPDAARSTARPARRPAGGCGSTPGRWPSASRDPGRAAAARPALVRGAARRRRAGVAERRLPLPRPARPRSPASPRCSTGCRWRRWSTAASPAPSCAAGWRRRWRASSASTRGCCA